MKNLRNIAIAVICLGLISLIICIASIEFNFMLLRTNPRGFATFTVICLLLSINLLLLEKKP